MMTLYTPIWQVRIGSSLPYLTMPPKRPSITCETSSKVAIDESPGVVIARAPWATPHSSDQARSRPVSIP